MDTEKTIELINLLSNALEARDTARMEELIETYNPSFPVPPVSTAFWNTISWTIWILDYLNLELNRKNKSASIFNRQPNENTTVPTEVIDISKIN